MVRRKSLLVSSLTVVAICVALVGLFSSRAQLIDSDGDGRANPGTFPSGLGRVMTKVAGAAAQRVKYVEP